MNFEAAAPLMAKAGLGAGRACDFLAMGLGTRIFWAEAWGLPIWEQRV